MGSDFLQVALLVLGTAGAVEMMMRQKEFKCSAPKLLHHRCVRVNHHSVLHRLAAGSDRCPPAIDLNEAEPTPSERQVRFAHGAQVRNIDVMVEGYPKESISLFGPDLATVYGQDNSVSHIPFQSSSNVKKPFMARPGLLIRPAISGLLLQF
jgi:hypothetical protein